MLHLFTKSLLNKTFLNPVGFFSDSKGHLISNAKSYKAKRGKYKRFSFAVALLAFFILGSSSYLKGQTTIFTETMGTVGGNTSIAAHEAANGFDNDIYTMTQGGATNPGDIRATSPSSGYTGASGLANVWLTNTNAAYGFAIESIDASTYTSLTVQFGYRKESSTALPTIALDYWNGTAYVNVPFTFNEASNASVGWYLSPVISLPAGAQISNLRLRWVKSGTVAARLDDIVLKGTSSSATSSVTAGAGSEPLTISSLTNTTPGIQVFDFIVTDDASGNDALPTLISQIIIPQGTGNDVATWTDAIAGAQLSEGTNTLTGTVNAGNITFSSIPNSLTTDLGYIADGGNKIYVLKIWLKTTITGASTIDGKNLAFNVACSNVTVSGSSTSMGACSAIESGNTNNAIDVVATKLNFIQQPSNTNTGVSMSPAVTVESTDINNNRDLNITSNINIKSTGTLTGSPVSIASVAGLATFSSLTHSVAGTSLTLNAERAGTLDWDITSTTFDITSNPAIWTNPITATDPSLLNPFTTGDVYNSNITVSGIGRGTGITASAASNRYSATGWNSGTLDANDYFYFTLTPNSGYQINLTSIVYTGQSSSTGPTNVAFRSSIDGYTANIGTPTIGGTTIDLSGAAYQGLTSAITFRFYGWGASAAGGTLSINDFTFNGSVGSIGPTITVETITDFGDVCISTTSAEKTYNVSGSNLTADISITAPTGFEISTTSGSGFTNSLILTQTGGVVASTPIYVRFVPTLVQAYSGNITHTSTGATTKNVVASGNGILAGANVTSLIATSSQNTIVPISWTNPACFTEVMIVAKLSSSITATPSGDGSAYTANLNFGTGTEIATGEYVVYKGITSPQTITNLVNGSTYYFKVFTRNETSWSSGIEVSAIPNVSPAIITEWSQGEPSNNNEWVEILVLQDHLDLRGWELRDDNSSGYLLKFKNVALWADVPIGTYILLYNPAPLTWTGLPAPDSLTGDCNFLVMITQAEMNTYFLEFSDPDNTFWSWNSSRAYGNSTNTDNPSLYNSAGTLIHDWDQGNSALFTTSTLRPGSGEGVYYTGADVNGISVASNWTKVAYNDAALTPGLYNTVGQGIWINGIRPYMNCSYRSVQSNNWDVLATWESTLDGVNWAPAIRIPDYSLNGTILVRNTHNVTLSAGKKVDQLIVEPFGTVTIPSGFEMTVMDGTDAIDVSVGGTLNAQGTVGGNGTIGFLANSTLVTNNTLGVNGVLLSPFSFDASNNVSFNFNGSSAQVTGSWMPSICKNITVNNNSLVGVLLSKSTEIKGNLTLTNGILNLNGYHLTLSGTVTGTGTLSGSPTSDMTIGGTSGGNLGTINFTTGAQTLNNFNFNRSGSAAEATIGSHITILNNLTMTSGAINMGTNILEIGSSETNIGSLAYTGGVVVGKVKRWFTTEINSGTTGIFPIGITNFYRSAQVDYTTAPGTGGSLTAQFITSLPSDYYSGLPLMDGAQIIDNLANEGFWQIDEGDGLNGGSYTITLTGNGFSSVLDPSKIRIVKRPTLGGNWTLNGSHVSGLGSPFTVTRENMTGFSQFALGGSFIENPLPIELLDFYGKYDDNTVNLYWSTASETNNDLFTVEHSSDAVSFISVTSVKGAGNSNKLLNYNAIDYFPIKGINYYRLKQTDFDSKYTYSKIISVNTMDNSCKLEIEQLYIQSNWLNIKLNCFDSKLRIDIVDITGRVVYTQSYNNSTNDSQNIIIPLSTLIKGIYFVKVNSEKYMVVKKFCL